MTNPNKSFHFNLFLKNLIMISLPRSRPLSLDDDQNSPILSNELQEVYEGLVKTVAVIPLDGTYFRKDDLIW
jgi:hypothetical protein